MSKLIGVCVRFYNFIEIAPKGGFSTSPLKKGNVLKPIKADEAKLMDKHVYELATHYALPVKYYAVYQ